MAEQKRHKDVPLGAVFGRPARLLSPFSAASGYECSGAGVLNFKVLCWVALHYQQVAE